MTKPPHERVMEVLGKAMEAPAAARIALLDSLCGHDAALRAEVERLLALEERAASALPDDMDARRLLSGLSEMRRQFQSGAPAARIAPGTTIGAYRFDNVLGQGGMGVVYRARDTRLDRPVAIKALPPSLAADASRLARFAREAKLLGSLSHPNVATVFGLEETDGAKYLVMELVEGRTLADRLSRGAMPIPDALSTAAQMAAGLSCAHEAGVVHRDLKPSNIMLTPDGKVKLLDFGLAREVQALSFGGDSTERDAVSPGERTPRGGTTSVSIVTREGSVIGTPRYMSPEQVRGMPVDRRTDVFAFGCVLYEMLTGRPAFDGDDPMEVAAAILEREPDFAALPVRTPAEIRRLLRRMLVRDAADRLRDMGDVRIELEEALAERGWLADSDDALARRSAVRRWLAPAAAACALGIGAAAMWFGLSGAAVQPPAPLIDEQFALPFPNNYAQPDLARIRVAISRDGRQIVLSASDGRHLQLWRRARGETVFSPIAETLGAWIPTISPDGQWVAYYQDGYVMKRRIAGGRATRVANKASYAGRFHWSTDDALAFAPMWSRGIALVPASGGEPVFITEPDYRSQEFAHISPAFTPGNRAVLFTIWDGKQGTRIDAVNVDGTNRHNVVPRGDSPRVVSTPNGYYLLYGDGGTIFAAPFDIENVACTGPAVALADGVMSNRPLFEHCYDVAEDGTLVYIPGPQFIEESRLAWLDSDDSTTPFNDDRRPFAGPTLSADGSKLAVLIKGEMYRPYIYHLQHETFDPAVPDADTESAAISPDGRWLAYSNNRDGPYSLWLRDLANDSDRKLLQGNTEFQMQLCWSADGRYVAFSMASDLRSTKDIWIVDATTGEARCFVERAGEQRAPQFSPDGRWLAYSDDESGVREIRLRRFPDGSLDRQITTGGGDWAQWSPDGGTLYFCRERKLWAVPVSLKDGTAAGRPRVVYDRDFGQSDFDLSDYTVASDGRILLVEPSERGPRVSAVHVVLHWYALLDR